MIKNRIGSTVALITFRLAAVGAVALAAPSNADQRVREHLIVGHHVPGSGHNLAAVQPSALPRTHYQRGIAD